jgi:hypothetical protein
MTMAWVGGGMAIAGLAGAVISSNAAQSAAQTQADAAGAASQVQQTQFQQQQANLAPWVAAGTGALNTLQQGLAPGGEFNKPFTMADFQQDPGMNFQKQQGAAAIGAQGAAAGKTFAPGTTAALEAQNQGLAATSYQNAFANYMGQEGRVLGATQSLANVGQTATGQLNAAGGTMAANVGSNIIGAGNAQAAGQVGSANAISGGLSGLGQVGLNASYMNQIMNPSSTPTPTNMTGFQTPAPATYNVPADPNAFLTANPIG